MRVAWGAVRPAGVGGRLGWPARLEDEPGESQLGGDGWTEAGVEVPGGRPGEERGLNYLRWSQRAVG